MRRVKRYLKLYQIFASQYIKSLMQSKADFLIGLCGFFISQGAGIAFLYLVFEQIPSIQEWTLEQMLFIYGFAQIPRGIDHLITDNLWMVSWRMVVKGTFDKYMLRPVNIFFQIICEKIQLDAFGELTVGLILVLRAINNGIVSITPFKMMFFLISVVAGASIYTSVKLFLASVAFWLKDSMAFLSTAYEVADFAKYPIEIYPKPIQIIISTILPFAFVAYIPCTYFLINSNLIKTIGIECAIAIVFWIVSYKFFIKGVSIYESSGN
ncbi:MAG: ABC-2 family transporter protein [Anaeroplasmataceae bacterium]|nr:ABC-2 family transporter protein [Anaeroplasmataceae bacterium]